MTEQKTASESGLAIGGDVKIKAGRDANIAGGEIWTGGLSYDSAWRDVAMSALGDAQASPVVRSAVDRNLDQIGAELAKPDPEIGLLQQFVGGIETVAPLVATALRVALPFLK